MLSRRPVPLLLALGLAFVSLAGRARPAAAVSIEGAPLAPIRGSVPVTVVIHAPYDMARAIRKLPTSIEEGPVVRLSIERVKAPGNATIRVFINYPTATADTPASDFHYVGSLTAFEDSPAGSPGDDYLLDAGRALKRLKKGERLLPGDNVAVTLVLAPETAAADVAIPIERVALSIETQ
ncbi:MAG TPA: hypothetical protein VGX68_01335 [Thermoanaerobaculia bacterium]|jgi:hypothetical protein|nr:hypothetical protein [Thermoanaerobaculia bacterium]